MIQTRINHRGFTLVELLATIAIIGILAACMVAALSQAQESAKKMRTRQLISKIHEQIMPRWEEFQTRRLPVTPPQSGGQFPQTSPQNPYVSQGMSQYSLAVAWFKLSALRELMRMELPDRYDDLLFTPKCLITQISNNGQTQNIPVQPALTRAYLQRIAAIQGSQVGGGGVMTLVTSSLKAANGPAECLYLTVSVGATDQDLYAMAFSPADWGDTDLDGMPEFLDGWGNPISFLRWAPGLNMPGYGNMPSLQSDLQPVYSISPSSPGARVLPPGLPSDPLISGNILTHFPVEINATSGMQYVSQFNYNNNHDAFDPLEVFPYKYARNVPEKGYNLVPLIFSAGPNGSLPDIINGASKGSYDGYGIYTGTITSWGQMSNPQCSDPYNFYNGSDTGNQSLQRAAVVDGTAYDDIHNHLIGY